MSGSESFAENAEENLDTLMTRGSSVVPEFETHWDNVLSLLPYTASNAHHSKSKLVPSKVPMARIEAITKAM